MTIGEPQAPAVQNSIEMPGQRFGFHDMMDAVASAQRSSQVRGIRPGLFEAVRKGEITPAQMDDILAFSDVQLELIIGARRVPDTIELDSPE